MTTIEKERVINLLQEHVNKVEALQIGSYAQAESLSLNTKILYSRYFQKNEFDLFDIVSINFRSSWDEAYARLLTVSQGMLYEMQLPAEEVLKAKESTSNSENKGWSFQKILNFIFVLAVPSIILWSFNAYAQWGWLALHPKRIAIYLSFQVTIALVSALLFTKNKQVRTIDWMGLALAMAGIIISVVA